MASNTIKTILVKAKDQASDTFKNLKSLYDQNRDSLTQMGNATGGVSNASLQLIAASQQNDAQMAANGMTMMANTLGLGEITAATGGFTTAVTDAVTWGQNLFGGLVTNQAQMASYNEAVAQSTGMTDTFTNAATTQFGIVDSLKNLWGEFGHSTATGTKDSGMLFSRVLFDYDNSAGQYDITIDWKITIG